MTKSTALLNIYAKQYIAEVFESRLRGEGFVCPDDKLLCWYRVRNHALTDSIIFNSRWSKLPIFLEIAYGIHPLFIKPVYNRNVYVSNNTIDSVRYRSQQLVEADRKTLSNYTEDIPVFAPMFAGRGIYTLDGILLPQMDRIQTIEDCYYWHKEYTFGARSPDEKTRTTEVAFYELPHTWIDLALYVDDREVYPLLKRAVKWNVEQYMWKNIYDPQNKKDAEEYTHWLQIDAALYGNNRENYMKILEKRKEENIGYLKKKLSIDTI